MRRLLFVLLIAFVATAQQQPDLAKALESQRTRTDRQTEDTQRAIDDVLWYHKLGDVARIEKYEITSSKPRREKLATDINAGNAIIFPVYVFAPKNLQGKAPTLIFAHGGVHGRLTSNYAHIFREALERGFVIVSPEYRGSIGHGSDLYNQIDYGGGGDRRHARRAQLGDREPAVRRREPRRHLRLEPWRLPRADEHLPLA